MPSVVLDCTELGGFLSSLDVVWHHRQKCLPMIAFFLVYMHIELWMLISYLRHQTTRTYDRGTRSPHWERPGLFCHYQYMYIYWSEFTMRYNIPPSLSFQFIYLPSKAVQSYLQVRGIVWRFENTKSACVDWRVGVQNIADLKRHLKAPTTLVTPKLDPYLILWYFAFVPC